MEDLDFFQDLPLQLPIGIFHTTIPGRLVYINPYGARIFGYKNLEEMKFINTHDLWADSTEREKMVSAADKEGIFDSDARMIKRDGTIIWVRIQGRVIKDGKGKVFAYKGTIQDITQQHEMEDALLASENRYRAISELTSDYTFSATIADDGTVELEWLEGAFKQITGYSWREFFTPGHWWKILLPEDVDRDRSSLAMLLQNNPIDDELCLVTKKGKIRWVRNCVKPVWDEKQQRVTKIIGAVRDITERKLAEEALLKSEQLFRALIEQSFDAVTMIGADGKILYDSPSMTRLLGYRPEEKVGRNLSEFIPNEELKEFAKNFAEFVRMPPGAVTSSLMHLIHKDGSLRLIEGVCTNLLHTPRVNAVVINYHDVTEQKKVQATLIESEKRYRILFEDSPVALVEMDFSSVKRVIHKLPKNGLEGFRKYIDAHPQVVSECASQIKVIDVNKATLQLYDVGSKEDFIANSNFWLTKENIDGFKEQLSSILEKKSQFEWEGKNRTLKGEPLYVRVSWIIAARHTGNLSHVLMAIENITRRKQFEDQLLCDAEELGALNRVSVAMRLATTRKEIMQVVLAQVKMIFNSLGQLLGMYDSKQEEIVFEFAQGAWEKLNGHHILTVEGVVKKVFYEKQPFFTNNLVEDGEFHWFPDLAQIPCLACVPLATDKRVIGILWLGRKEPWTDKNIQLLKAIALMATSALERQALHEDLQDKLTALQEAQAQVIQAEKLASIGQLTSGIAHELNNPLTAVILYAQMIQKNSLDSSIKKDLDMVVRESLRASKIVRGLLDFSRQRIPEKKPTDINSIISNAIDLMSYELRSRNIQISFALSPDLPIISADPYQVEQVIINLLKNACEAIGQKKSEGNLWVTTEWGSSKGKYESLLAGKVIRFTIKDDGPGIKSEHLTKIFDPFFTTKEEGSGTGLGLSICHGIISEHGGNIWVESKIGQETKFIVEMPIIPPDLPESPILQKPVLDVKNNLSLLIIDDERNVLEVLSRALTGKGYHVDAVENALDGLEKISRNFYSTILCDLRMPGMNGMDFYNEIVAKNPDMAKRVILITGGLLDKQTQDMVNANKILCLSKPFELDELITLIQILGKTISDKTV